MIKFQLRPTHKQTKWCKTVVPFKDQKSADAIRKQLKDLGMKIGNDIQPVYKVQKLSDKRKLQEAKPPLVNNQRVVYSGARGAPWVSKFGNPLIRKILVLTSAYVRPSVRTDSGGGRGESQDNPTGGGGMPSFLVVEVNNTAAGSSIFNTIIVIHAWNEDL